MRRVWLFLASRFRFFPTPEELKAETQQRLRVLLGEWSERDREFEAIVAQLRDEAQR